MESEVCLSASEVNFTAKQLHRERILLFESTAFSLFCQVIDSGLWAFIPKNAEFPKFTRSI